MIIKVNDNGTIKQVVIPTKTSELTNDSNFVSDADYIHTDNNFTDSEKSKLASVEQGAEVNTVDSVNGMTGDVVLTASDIDALPSSIVIPSKTSDLVNDSGYISSYTETDPTVPAWAKAAEKPTYTAAEVGALPDTTQALKNPSSLIITAGGTPLLEYDGSETKTIDMILVDSIGY